MRIWKHIWILIRFVKSGSYYPVGNAKRLAIFLVPSIEKKQKFLLKLNSVALQWAEFYFGSQFRLKNHILFFTFTCAKKENPKKTQGHNSFSSRSNKPHFMFWLLYLWTEVIKYDHTLLGLCCGANGSFAIFFNVEFGILERRESERLCNLKY